MPHLFFLSPSLLWDLCCSLTHIPRSGTHATELSRCARFKWGISRSCIENLKVYEYVDAPKNNPSWQSVCDSTPVPGNLEVSTSRHSFMRITIWPKLQASVVLYLETLLCDRDYTLALTGCYRYKVFSRLFHDYIASSLFFCFF